MINLKYKNPICKWDFFIFTYNPNKKMKKSIFVFFFFILNFVFSQNRNSEKMPVFKECENLNEKNLENCFYKNLQNFVYTNFKIPEKLKQENYKGNITVLFEVDTTGIFKTMYVDANNQELIAESKRIFETLPKINPATYNGKATYATYNIKIAIPLQQDFVTPQDTIPPVSTVHFDKNKKLNELENVTYKKNDGSLYKTHLNIPFSHAVYSQFDAAMNQMGANNHSASKPYSYAEVLKYYDLKSENQKIMLPKTSWWGRKIFNENLVEFTSDDYWLTLNPIFDLRLGKSSPSNTNYTYQNTRALQVQGALGDKLFFSSTIYESQGRFADYYNRYAESIKPSGGNPAVVPGIGIAKEFGTNGYDFPSAEANITFKASNSINLQLGYGRNFLGDGYRSILMSDTPSPYPFFKINTTFWKIKYTNTYMWLKDIRPEVTLDKTYATKFMANHYLSWNVSNKLNIGFFESVVWGNQNERGFDVNFVNPIIFYRTVEFTSSSKSGNAVLGLTSKYKWNNQLNFYGQFILDEFSLGEIKKQNGSWKNKYGYQLGLKYYNPLDINNLTLQLEYNYLRPYVYSHSNILTNYGQNNQSFGHPWGANLKELIAIAHYRKNRLFADAKFTYGIRGLDFDTPDDKINYGGNPYKNYDVDRFADLGVQVGQGNKTSVFIADLQLGYLVNPTTNLKLFGNFIYRNFSPTIQTTTTFKENTTWFSIGLRTDIFNFYLDY